MIRPEILLMDRTLRAALGEDHVHRVVTPKEAPLPQLVWTRSGSDETTTTYDGEAHIPVVLLTVYDDSFEGAEGFLDRALAILRGQPSGGSGDRARLDARSRAEMLDGPYPPLDPARSHLAQAPDDPVDDYSEETGEYAVQVAVMLRTE